MLFILGISPISYYLVDILKRGDVALDPEWSAVGVGIIETIGKYKYYFIYSALFFVNMESYTFK